MELIIAAYLLLCLLIVEPPLVRPLALVWFRFWRVVTLVVYLRKPWRVAMDRARREIV